MYSCAMSSRSTCPNPGSPDILRRADAKARGLPQSSAPPASAINSLLREMAKRVSMVKKYATALHTSPTSSITIIDIPLPLLSSSLRREPPPNHMA